MDTTCNGCGGGFTAARSDARYCSPRCRTAAHRVRTGQAAAVQARRPALSEQFFRMEHRLTRAADELGRLMADDRLPRNRAKIAAQNLGRLTMARDQIDQAIEALQGDRL